MVRPNRVLSHSRTGTSESIQRYSHACYQRGEVSIAVDAKTDNVIIRQVTDAFQLDFLVSEDTAARSGVPGDSVLQAPGISTRARTSLSRRTTPILRNQQTGLLNETVHEREPADEIENHPSPS